MANNPASLPGGVSQDKLKELRQRIFFVIGALLVFRIGVYISIPGIDPVALKAAVPTEGTILEVFNMFSGGAFERFSLFALGIMPYISASIIIQLLSYITPSLQQLRKEGESGRRKITQYTRYATVVLALFQAIGMSVMMEQTNAVSIKGFPFIFTATVTLVTGTMFLMWLGEQITERGIGNGISLIIFAGIVVNLPSAVSKTASMVNDGTLTAFVAILLFVFILAVIAFVIFVERGQRRITVNYAKRQQGRKMYQAQSSFLPLKLNMAGVIPPIFASSLILFPATLARFFGESKNAAGELTNNWLVSFSNLFQQGELTYMLAYAFLIIFFCFFYTALVFNSRETADNLKKSGGFIPGIRPGEQTAKYVDNVLSRLTTAGALYLTVVCLIPGILSAQLGVPFSFGGTSLLIIVVVVMDFMSQMQAHMLSHQYEGLMKKSKFKGFEGQ
ncbi:Protein translocase subunit SecY [hydrothermal vent metagenome]|uniref:Protein translocase subunit SecY n=1 Tax=hydrothermal vent metagenome TaxID=652676 RepID=A0A3B0Y5V3_9ZZZZ